MDMKKTVSEYRQQNRTASFRQVQKYAAATFTTPEEQQEFCKIWWQADILQQESQNKVSGAWPEEKYG